MEGYAEAMLGPHSGFGGDAMTVTAYLGLGALRPVLDRAAECKAAAFVVVRSSNPEGRSLQDARLAEGSGMNAQKLSVTAACLLALFSFAASGSIGHAQQFAYCKADVRRLCAGIRPGAGTMDQARPMTFQQSLATARC